MFVRSETYEDPPASKVHIEANSSYTYTKPSTREEYSASRLKFVVLTSSDGSSSSVSRHFYQALNKQYYAHRHGYLYKYVLSNHYLQFFGPRFLEVLLHVIYNISF